MKSRLTIVFIGVAIGWSARWIFDPDERARQQLQRPAPVVDAEADSSRSMTAGTADDGAE